MLTILLFGLAGELRGQKLDGVHGRYEVVDMVLREVATKEQVSTPGKTCYWYNSHAQPTILGDMSRHWFQITHQQFDAGRVSLLK